MFKFVSEQGKSGAQKNLVTVVSDFFDHLQDLVDKEVALFKAKLKVVATNYVVAVVCLVVTAVFALFTLGYFLYALNNLLAIYVGGVLSAVIVGFICLAVALVFLLIAVSAFKKGNSNVPDIRQSVEKDVQIFKDTIATTTTQEEEK